MSPTQPATAYSYIRFSHPDQAKGDSIRRQAAERDAWLALHPEVILDTSLKLEDRGRSGFKRVNFDRYALAELLRLVERGRVQRGSYLLLENLDRLSREDEVPAVHLLTSILMAGIVVVQLSPSELLLTDKSDGFTVMRAVMELSRGHGESAIKSKRNGATWEQKREAARRSTNQPPRKKDQRITRSLTNQLPAWVRDVDGTLRLDTEKAATVRRMFALAADGLGCCLIIKALDAEGRAPFGPSGLWSRGYVGSILKDRRAVGEFQPRHASGKPAGDPIPGYYPAAVKEEEWLAARAGMGGRKQPRGRVGEQVNVFSDLLHDARTGDRYYVATRSPGGKRHRVLIGRTAAEKGRGCVSFPFGDFEKAVLSLLREVDPREVLGDAPGQEEVIVLSNELEHVQGQQAELQAALARGFSPSLEKAARALDGRERELREQLKAAQDKAAFPAGEDWGAAMSLAAAVEKSSNPQEARLKLRPILRRRISSIWVLAVPRGRDRLAAVQVYFEGDGHRDYLILSQPPKAGRCGWRVEGGWWVRSLADTTALGDLDLRRREHARRLEAALLALDLDEATGE
jgi:DNA invertase Pin-like site-specific DNA recombinase